MSNRSPSQNSFITVVEMMYARVIRNEMPIADYTVSVIELCRKFAEDNTNEHGDYDVGAEISALLLEAVNGIDFTKQ